MARTRTQTEFRTHDPNRISPHTSLTASKGKTTSSSAYFDGGPFHPQTTEGREKSGCTWGMMGLHKLGSNGMDALGGGGGGFFGGGF
jgi:hypothetical protein